MSYVKILGFLLLIISICIFNLYTRQFQEGYKMKNRMKKPMKKPMKKLKSIFTKKSSKAKSKPPSIQSIIDANLGKMMALVTIDKSQADQLLHDTIYNYSNYLQPYQIDKISSYFRTK